LAERLLDQQALPTSETENRRPILIKVPVRFRRRGVEAKLIVLDRQQGASEPDANLVKALARAHEWFGRIARGEASGIGEIARAERLDRSYVTRVLCLAFLAPEMTKVILEGCQPTELTAKRLISSALSLPLLWADQVADRRIALVWGSPEASRDQAER
jgi:site-specific DNA recombinase